MHGVKMLISKVKGKINVRRTNHIAPNAKLLGSKLKESKKESLQ